MCFDAKPFKARYAGHVPCLRGVEVHLRRSPVEQMEVQGLNHLVISHQLPAIGQLLVCASACCRPLQHAVCEISTCSSQLTSPCIVLFWMVHIRHTASDHISGVKLWDSCCHLRHGAEAVTIQLTQPFQSGESIQTNR